MSETRSHPKILLTDFEVPGKTPAENMEDLMLKLKVNNNSKIGILSGRDVTMLLAAKNRRHPEYFHGIFISGRLDMDHATTGKSQALLEVAKAIYSGASPRTQIIYYSNFKNHYFGFDIALNADKKLSIFTLESALDNCQSKVIDALLLALAELNIPCIGYACRGNNQSDDIACSFFMYTMLSELAKISSFHEELKTYPQGSEPPLSPKVDSKPYTIISPVVWINLSSVPLKLITMTQSYTRMLEFLLERKIPKAESEKIISDHKQRYQYKGGNYYYINLRKDRIANRLITHLWGKNGFNNPMLTFLKSQIDFNFKVSKKTIMLNLSHLTFREKIRYLTSAVGCVFNAYKVGGSPLYKATSITTLRAALIDILTTIPRPEGAIARLPNGALIDGPFDFMLEFDPDDQEEKKRFRILIDALVLDPTHQEHLLAYQRDEKTREQLLSKYNYERFDLLRKTASQFTVLGQSHTAKLARQIASLTDEHLAQFFVKYPDAASLKNLKEVAIYLKGIYFGFDEKDAENVSIIRAQAISPLEIPPVKLKK